MDRSFLSDPAVVAATRGYVCVRAATYEDAEEVPFLTSLFRGRTPLLENTVFALVAPDGKTRISNGGRSPQMAFRTDDNTRIIRRLKGALEDYEIKDPKAPDQLPFAKSLRLALNVAACDNQPLLICVADDPEQTRKIEKTIAKHAWTDPFLGQFHYVSSRKTEITQVVKEAKIDSGFLVVQPDRFGTGGTILAEHAAGDDSKGIDQTMKDALEAFGRDPHKDTRDHVRQGKRSGVHWETATPITDSGGPRRRERPPR